MNKQALLIQYGYFKMVHGVTLRTIGTFSNEELDYRPKSGMRSVRELILHIYGMLNSFSKGVMQGKITKEIENPTIPETVEGKAAIEALKTVGDCQAYARSCFKVSEEAIAAITDERLAQLIESPFGTFAAWQYFSFAYDEHWHHRGQLYTYLRLIGKEPPMLYDYENSLSEEPKDVESYQAVALTAHQVNYPDSIKFRAGDRVVVGRGDVGWPGWIWTTIESGNHGWAPESYLEISGSSGLALRDFESTELPTQAGEFLNVSYELAGWAWASNQSGIEGWVPLASIQKTGVSL